MGSGDSSSILLSAGVSGYFPVLMPGQRSKLFSYFCRAVLGTCRTGLVIVLSALPGDYNRTVSLLSAWAHCSAQICPGSVLVCACNVDQVC